VRFAFIFSYLIFSFFLTGCDQIRDNFSSLIKKPSAEETLKNVNSLVDNQEYEKALKTVKSQMGKFDSSFDAEIAFAGARASAFKGDTDNALFYLSQALKVKEVKIDEVMFDPAFAQLQTNVQFLQIITQGDRFNKSSDALVKPEIEVGAGDALIRQDSRGSEIRAGDVVIKMNN
jgi:hypothetical protein